MKVLNQEVKSEPLDAVRPHPRNPRQGDVGAIHGSIEANGFYGTIVAQRSTGYILAGNHRWEAARHAGAKEIPVAWVDVDDTAAMRILLADNRTNDLATNDDLELAKILQEIITDTGTLDGTGYDADALDDLIADLQREGERPAFEPNLTPTLATTTHDEEDVARAAEKLGDQFKGERKLRTVLCPECGEEFYVDE